MNASQATAIIMALIAGLSQYEVFSTKDHFEIRLANKQAAIDEGYTKFAQCRAGVRDGN